MILVHCIAISVLFIASVYCTCKVSPAADPDQPDIILGGLFPVHKNEDGKCGDVLDLGIQRLEAMVLTVCLINEDPDLLPGLKLGFDIRDTCTQTNMALQSSLDFVLGKNFNGSSINSERAKYSYLGVDTVTNGISGVVGSASSSESITAASLLQVFNTPQISYASTARILSDKTRYEYFLRTLPPDLYQAKVMVELVQQYNWSYVIPINSDDVYGREGIAAFVNELEAISTNTVDPNDNSTGANTSSTPHRSFCTATTPISISVTATDNEYDNVVNIINSAWKGNASVIVLFGQLSTAEGLIQAIERYPNHRPLTFVVSDAVGNNLHPVFYSTYHTIITVLPEYRESKEFNEYFTALKPTSSDPWFIEYWESVFGCTFNRSHHEQSSDLPLCDESEQSLVNSSYKQNSKVPFVMDAVLAYAHAIHNLLTKVCHGITLCEEVVTSRYSKRVIKGDMLLQYLKNVVFKGFSADEIDFDANGDQAGGYWIDNLQYDSDGFRFVRIGEWTKHTSLINTNEPISWEMNNQSVPVSICSEPCSVGHYPVVVESAQSRCCWECERCRGNKEVSDGTKCVVCEQGYSPNEDMSSCQMNPLTFLTWYNPVSWVAVLLSLVGLAGTLLTAFVFVAYFNHTTVKASSRELSAISLTGLGLCFLIPFLSIGKPNPYTCGISRFLFGFAFSLCYASLLVKTNRIHRIFNQKVNASQRLSLISSQAQVMLASLIILVQVALSTAWLFIEKPEMALKFSDDHTEAICNDTPYIGVIVSLAYNIILLVITMYFAIRSRKIPENFNEAKFININLILLMFIWVTFIPLYIALDGATTISHTYLSGMELIAIDLSAMSTLCLLYFPKLYSMFNGKNSENTEQPNGQNTSMSDRIRHSRIGSLTSTSKNTLGAATTRRAMYADGQVVRTNSLPKKFDLSPAIQSNVAMVVPLSKQSKLEKEEEEVVVEIPELPRPTIPTPNDSNPNQVMVNVKREMSRCFSNDSLPTIKGDEENDVCVVYDIEEGNFPSPEGFEDEEDDLDFGGYECP